MTTNYDNFKAIFYIEHRGTLQDLAQEIMEIPPKCLYNENTLKEWLESEAVE